jgi:hypothetical protein
MSEINWGPEGVGPFDSGDSDTGGQIGSLLLLGIRCFRIGKKLDVPCSSLDVVQSQCGNLEVIASGGADRRLFRLNSRATIGCDPCAPDP